MRKPVVNKVASVMDRLRALATELGQPFDLLLTGYVPEREACTAFRGVRTLY